MYQHRPAPTSYYIIRLFAVALIPLSISMLQLFGKTCSLLPLVIGALTCIKVLLDVCALLPRSRRSRGHASSSRTKCCAVCKKRHTDPCLYSRKGFTYYLCPSCYYRCVSLHR